MIPYEHPSHCIRLLQRIEREQVTFEDLKGREKRACRELIALGGIRITAGQTLNLSPSDLLADGELNQAKLLDLLKGVPGGSEALALLEENPAANPRQIGDVFRQANSAEWRPETMRSAGVAFRAWVRHAGIETRLRPGRASREMRHDEDTLF